MNTKTLIRPVRWLFLCLTVVMSAGCETLRWHEYAYQDLVQQNQERREIDALAFKPGTFFGSW